MDEHCGIDMGNVHSLFVRRRDGRRRWTSRGNVYAAWALNHWNVPQPRFRNGSIEIARFRPVVICKIGRARVEARHANMFYGAAWRLRRMSAPADGPIWRKRAS